MSRNLYNAFPARRNRIYQEVLQLNTLENDSLIFGLNKNSTINDLKQSYRLLLKKYHPDLHAGNREYDLKILGIINAYHRLLKQFSNASENSTGPDSTDIKNTSDTGLVKHKDPAYAYYKKGIAYYNKLFSIDPLDWLKLRKAEMNRKRNQSSGNNNQTLLTIEELLHNTSRGIYYFTIVTTYYPQSAWASDSTEKINYLNRNLKEYLKTKNYLTNKNAD
ncbi:MAG: DnaJ domain-containing protein [Spirochaetales bacterium]|nr:DnaJ domain-containing protein [Spirochaetales bacterium]